MTTPSIPPPVTYPQIKASLRTGDLLFLHGTALEDLCIELDEWKEGLPEYSHVGMIIRDEANLYFWDAPGGGDWFDDPYYSDPLNRISMDPTPKHGGCRVAKLEEILPYYAGFTSGGVFHLRPLKAPSPITADQWSALRVFIDQVDGFPFTPDGGPGLLAQYKAGEDERTTLWAGTYFCAQLVADSYLHMGLLDQSSTPANGYAPGAFASSDPSVLPLRNAALGDIVAFTWSPPPAS